MSVSIFLIICNTSLAFECDVARLHKWGNIDVIDRGIFSNDQFWVRYQDGHWRRWNEDMNIVIETPLECGFSKVYKLIFASGGKIYLIDKYRSRSQVRYRGGWEINIGNQWEYIY